MVKAAGLEKSIFFLGNRNDVPDCLNAMDLFALPSFGNEGVPQGIMQAMACGLPVVSTAMVGAISEAVIDGKTGFTLVPQVQEILTSHLAELTELKMNYVSRWEKQHLNTLFHDLVWIIC